VETGRRITRATWERYDVPAAAIATDDKDIGFTQEEFLNRFDVGIQNPRLDGGFDDEPNEGAHSTPE